VKRDAAFDYIPIISAGTRFPFDHSIELPNYLKPTTDNTSSLDFTIAEIAQATSPGTRTVFDAAGKPIPARGRENVAHAETIRLLRDHCTIELDPPGNQAQDDRLDVSFDVDENRRLRLTVWDRMAHRYLLKGEPVSVLE
jgi:hypothetical protein